MITLSAGIRTLWVGMLGYVLKAAQAMAGLDQMGGDIWGWPLQCPGNSFTGLYDATAATAGAWWRVAPNSASSTHMAVGPAAAPTTTKPPYALTPLPLQFSPAEWTHLRVLRERHQAEHIRFTTAELAHLQFVRWMHLSGRLCRPTTSEG